MTDPNPPLPELPELPEYPPGEGELIQWGPSTITWVLEFIRTVALVVIAIALVVIA